MNYLASNLPTGLLPEWLSPKNIIEGAIDWSGPWVALAIVLLIIYAETGLLIGFFLPGDSLLFTTGMFIASNTLDIPLWAAIILLFLAAFIGDQQGYYIGKKTGPSLFNKPDSKLFKQENVQKAHTFFDKYGGRSVILARFVPVIRTFLPVTVGVAQMNYKKFTQFNVIGALLWAVGITLIGFYLGQFPFIQDNLDTIIILLVIVSLLPVAYEIFKGWLENRKEKSAGSEN